MNSDKTILLNYLKGIISLSEERALTIAEAFRSRHIKKGEFFLKEGSISDEYLFLEKGFLRSFLWDTEGNEVTVNFFAQNNVVFEVASFFQRIPTQENIEALTDSYGWVLSFKELNELFHTIPEFRELGRALLVRGFIAFKERTIAMINTTAEQRYEILLRSKPDIIQNAPLKYIASYLGITDSSLSRIRKEFSKK